MKKRYKNVAFLTELLINIFIFSISCAILVGLFGQANLIARQTREESFADAEAYALLQIAGAKGIDDLPQSEKRADGTVVCYYDEKWHPTEKEGAAYQIALQMSPKDTGAGTLSKVVAVCSNSEGKEICRLQTSVYSPAEGGGAV